MYLFNTIQISFNLFNDICIVLNKYITICRCKKQKRNLATDFHRYTQISTEVKGEKTEHLKNAGIAGRETVCKHLVKKATLPNIPNSDLARCFSYDFPN